jgi:hypothetical protein
MIANLRPVARRLVAALFLVLPAAALADRPTCACEHLESLQQDLKNALYLEGFMRRLAAEMAAVEAQQKDLNDNHPTHRDAGRPVWSVSDQAREVYMNANLRLPVPRVTGYTGPEKVDMIRGTCAQADADLAGLRDGSPCAAMAEAALRHEARHRARCITMGPGPYWERLASQVALEEAEDYKAQAADLRADIRRLLDTATITYHGTFTPTVSMPGAMTASYLYGVETGDIGGAAGGPESWTMTGIGSFRTSITSATIAGMACTPTGELNADLAVRLETDGLTFGLSAEGQQRGGTVGLKCKLGGGMSLPVSDPISGQITSAQPLHAGDNRLTEDWTAAMRAILAGSGVQVSGTTDMVLSVTCR